MSADTSFEDLVRRVRQGDQAAAADLVKRYEPHIRRAVRIRLMRYPQMRRLLDSVDICQSVMGSFFLRAARGEYRLDRPDELQNLLVIMAYHKLVDIVRKKHLPEPPSSDQPEEPPGREDSPSDDAMYRELLQLFRERLSPEERELADLRANGMRWNDIAERLQDNPERLRKKLERAVRTVARSLGIEYGADDE
jgi:RNA polymerase sigma-70 factor (ECF subfamily)